jgi:hypothetical protein
LLSTGENETCPLTLIVNSPVRIVSRKVLINLRATVYSFAKAGNRCSKASLTWVVV